MAFSRSLLLKGLAGVAAVGAVGGGVGIAYRDDIENLFNSNKKVNDKLGSLGLEEDCLLKKEDDSTNFSKECPLNEEKLKNIKFSNKGEGDLTVKYSGDFPSDLKLKIDGTKEGITFSFKGISDSSPISIFGDKSKGKIVIKSEEQKFKEVDGRLSKSASLDETLKGFNEQLEKLNAPVECRYDEAETDASVECPVTEEDLKTLKFSGLGEGDQKVKGEVLNDLKLKAERNQENAMSLYFTGLGENLKIYMEQSEGEIVVKSGKKFKVGEDGKLKKVSVVVTPELKAKLGEFNKQLEKIKAPLQCRFDEEEGDESVECPVTHDQLKKMEFSNKKGIQDLRIVGSIPNGLKLRVERDQENVMSLYFTGLEQNLTIYGYKSEGKIIVRGSETKFKVKENKLEKESISSDSTLKDKLKKFNNQLEKINAPSDCRFDDAEAEETLECPINKDQFEQLEFSNKGTNNVKVIGWTTGPVKLKAEKDSNNEMSLSFPGLGATSSTPVTIYGDIGRGKIVIKNEEQKFKVVNNKLTKGTPSKELKNFNEKLGEVNAPIECRFDEAETEESVECSVSESHLPSMALSATEWEGLTLSENGLTGMKLRVQLVKTFDSKGRENGKDLILNFKDYNKTVKVMKGRKEIVSFVKGTNPEFEIYGDDEEEGGLTHLSKRWDDPEAFEDLFNLDCGFEDQETEVEDKRECTFTKELKEINVGKGTGDEFEKLTIESISGKNFEIHAEEEDYNQGYRFVYSGEKVSGREGTGLEPGSSYEFRWKSVKGKPREYYLAKKAK